MQRVGCPRPALISLTSKGVRYSSSIPPVKPRKPVVEYGGVVIPSAQEIRALKSKTKPYKTDISYLKFESNQSLAARLARPTLDLSLARENAAATGSPTSDSAQTPKEPEKPTPTPTFSLEDLTRQRREARLQREADRAAWKAKEAAWKAEKEAREREKTHAAIRDFRPLTNINNTPSLITQLSEAVESHAYIAKLASESATKRREARLQREVEGLSSDQRNVSTGRRSRGPSSSTRKRKDAKSQQEEDESLELQLNQESDSRGFEPEFKGPEKISDTLIEVVGREKTPPLQFGHIAGGNYSHFVTPSAQAFSTHQMSWDLSDLPKWLYPIDETFLSLSVNIPFVLLLKHHNRNSAKRQGCSLVEHGVGWNLGRISRTQR
ncbi:hypothetical protein BDZ97DRAFT_1752958 [Flammula alnicola]|nr:hypothetical protein BDZ97DRAFT_1752958 [Flammula alnicola]